MTPKLIDVGRETNVIMQPYGGLIAKGSGKMTYYRGSKQTPYGEFSSLIHPLFEGSTMSHQIPRSPAAKTKLIKELQAQLEESQAITRKLHSQSANIPDRRSDVQHTIDNRDSTYGGFEGVAELEQALKDTMREHEKWESLDDAYKCALDMMVHKIGRVVNGNPHHVDNWHDLSGYAELGKRHAINQQHRGDSFRNGEGPLDKLTADYANKATDSGRVSSGQANEANSQRAQRDGESGSGHSGVGQSGGQAGNRIR